VGYLQEAKAEKAIEVLARMVVTEATVRRHGMKKRISSEDLVPGDVVLLQPGDKVPADLRLFRVRDLQVDESAQPKLSREPPASRSWKSPSALWHRKTTVIAVLSILAILLHLVLRLVLQTTPSTYQIPLLATLAVGGLPLLYELLRKLMRREFGSDLLGGISIITSVLLGEYLAGSIIVLMLSGGEALESYALRSASSVLAALAKRVPSIAHRKRGSEIVDVALHMVAVDDTLVIYPHDICPVDGVVTEGRGMMDESYLTGEPFQITKTSGSTVISGAINGESALTIRTTKRAADSRYAKIMEVMRESEARRPQLRRLGDRLGAIYTPVALTVAFSPGPSVGKPFVSWPCW
jgi:cation transport ATPase